MTGTKQGQRARQGERYIRIEIAIGVLRWGSMTGIFLTSVMLDAMNRGYWKDSWLGFVILDEAHHALRNHPYAQFCKVNSFVSGKFMVGLPYPTIITGVRLYT